MFISYYFFDVIVFFMFMKGRIVKLLHEAEAKYPFRIHLSTYILDFSIIPASYLHVQVIVLDRGVSLGVQLFVTRSHLQMIN